jgi:hypothetical protein
MKNRSKTGPSRAKLIDKIPWKALLLVTLIYSTYDDIIVYIEILKRYLQIYFGI